MRTKRYPVPGTSCPGVHKSGASLELGTIDVKRSPAERRDQAINFTEKGYFGGAA